MRKNWLVLLAMIVLAAIFFVGCGDDDETITEAVTPATFTNGDIYIDNSYYGLYFYIYTFVHGGANPTMDSLKVDTMLAGVSISYYWNYADPYWYFEYYENDTPSDYESGDDITITMYGSGRSSACTISLLDYSDDQTSIISPDYNETVDTNSTVEIVWEDVDNAEFYALYLERRWDSSGTYVYEYTYTYSDDTTFTMPARFTDTTVDYFYVYVQPTCGPNPQSYSGNWTGTLTTGVLYSYAEYDYLRVYVEPEGPPPPAKVNRISKEDDVAPSITPREIMQGLYGLK